MVDFVPIEKGTPIRQPSVANLMIDSTDRDLTIYPAAGNFQITKPNAILNGFFTRIAATEIVLDWGVPNIVANINSRIRFTVTGQAAINVDLDTGFFTIAQALDSLVIKMTTAASGLPGPPTFTVAVNNGQYSIQISAGTFYLTQSLLSDQLGFNEGVASAALFQIVGANLSSTLNGPDLRPWEYLDFVSSQLTYAQDVKDGTTNTVDRNVLLRFYFAWDNPPQNDKYGFPILPGYTKMVLRRIFSPAKQIRWESNLPVGNLAFEVYGKALGVLNTARSALLGTSGSPNYGNRFDWQMTLQVSEV
jgi:hypothetical protein